jgi:pimeloyl-ACP methyl ester carboxylesterase
MLVPSTDGVVLSVHDLGGTGPLLVLAHATGFHGRVFAPLAGRLADNFHCLALDFRGHGDAETPAGIDLRWSGLADDVIAAVTGGDASPPVFGFGHSSGGAAMLMAAARRHELFRSLFCFEPILWPDPGAAQARAEKLSEGARRRRASFASLDEAYANYASKPPFSWLDQAALQAYVANGFTAADDGSVRLRCAPAIEAQMYLEGAANDSFNDLARVTCPVVVARGTERGAVERDVIDSQVDMLVDGTVIEFDGLGHFGPLEDPGAVAAAILHTFDP